MNPIEQINIFGIHAWPDGGEDITVVEVVAGGLNEKSTTEFSSRKEAVAYAERISTYYGVEITDLGVAE